MSQAKTLAGQQFPLACDIGRAHHRGMAYAGKVPQIRDFMDTPGARNMERAMTEAFGRSPAMDALGDIKGMNLHLERIAHYGVIPRGITVYRHAPRDWRILPESTK